MSEASKGDNEARNGERRSEEIRIRGGSERKEARPTVLPARETGEMVNLRPGTDSDKYEARMGGARRGAGEIKESTRGTGARERGQNGSARTIISWGWYFRTHRRSSGC